MDYENKLKEIINSGNTPFADIDILVKYFPELKENEDEKIRKSIIHLVTISYENGGLALQKWEKESMLAWLEKQGESIRIKKGKNYLCTKTHKYAGTEWIEGVKYYSPEDYSLVNQGCTYYCPKYSKEEHNNFFKEVEYDGCLEVDKIEPKFKVGDFIKHNKANIICKVISVNSGSYYVENIETNGGIELFNAEQNFKLWTIQDAKNGDILTYKNDDVEWILIYQYYIIPESRDVPRDALKYHALFTGTDFYDSGIHGLTSENYASCFIPATKEQRDLFFQKMKEAGYMWDEEKKELRRIEKQKEPMVEKCGDWSDVRYMSILQELHFLKSLVEYEQYINKEDISKNIEWLESLKHRIKK